MTLLPISVLLLAALCVPHAAAAEAELRLGVESVLEYDDNVLVRSDNVLSDFLVRAGPRLELRDEQGNLRYEVRYFPSYEKFLDLSDLDGWNHDAFANVTWQATGRTSVSVREQYIDSNRAVQVLGQGDPIDPTGEAAAVLGRRGFTQNIASGELNHRLTQVDDLSLTLQNVLSESEPFEDLTVTEGDVTSIGLSWLRALSSRNQAGIFVRYTTQSFEDVTQRAETLTDFYNASLQWVYRFDPTWSLSVSAGPTWVSSDLPDREVVSFSDQPLYPLIQGDAGAGPVLIDTCPRLADGTILLAAECDSISANSLFPGSGSGGLVFRNDLLNTTDLGVIGDVPDASSDGLTYFAALALTKDWRTVTASLRYSRDASTTAAASGNVRDVVQASVQWRPTERWKFGFVAAWEQREAATTGVAYDRVLVPATAVVIDPTQPFSVGLASIGQSAGALARKVDRTVTNDRYSLSLSIQYTLTRRTSLFARLFWIDQSVEDDFFGTVNAKRFDAVVGVRYYLDPIHLPI